MTERTKIRMERTYDAPLDDVWDLWTTKEGLESWWGPEGFRVEVRSLGLRPGGTLAYAMIACRAQEIEFMKRNGMPIRHDAHITYTDVTPKRRLAYDHSSDFIPDVPVYQIATVIELTPVGEGVHMALSFDPMHDALWTDRQVAGWTSELGKLDRLLANR